MNIKQHENSDGDVKGLCCCFNLFTSFMSLKSVRNQLLFSHYEGVINDEEFMLLYDINKSENADLPYDLYERFDFDVLENDECLSEFRFRKQDIPLLAEVLHIPEQIRCYQRSVCSDLEALCIVLKRLSYPCRYADMISSFARPVPTLCIIYNHMIDFIYQTHSHRIIQWNNQILNPNAMQTYAAAITDKGSPLINCFGFDGTVRPICRPEENQRMVYYGHKRMHALKFQSVALPNGLIGNLFGPVEGKRHDSGMLKQSHLLEDLQRHAFSPELHPLCLYGDPAYPLRVHLQAPFRDVVLTPQMEMFNRSMSSVRVSVEWLFGDICNYFKFIDFKKGLKIGLSTIGKMYVVCSLLRNALTCLYGNTTSEFFDLDPPTLEEYFA